MKELTAEDAPLCPYCDQPLFGNEEAVVMQVEGCLVLVHPTCLCESCDKRLHIAKLDWTR